MKPRFILNSFTRQLYYDEEANRKIIPLIEPQGERQVEEDMEMKEEKEKDYWSLRHNSSVERIQRMKDAKIYEEIKSIKDKPEIDSKSKKMVDQEFKKVGVLKRMKMMNCKTTNKAEQKVKEADYKIQQEKTVLKQKNLNPQFSTIQSKYMSSIRHKPYEPLLQPQPIAKKNRCSSQSCIQCEDIRKNDLNKLITFMTKLV